MNPFIDHGLFGYPFSTEKISGIVSDHGRLQGMLDFEAALARAEAGTGVIPREAALAIDAQCRAELFDIDALARGTAVVRKNSNSAIGAEFERKSRGMISA